MSYFASSFKNIITASTVAVTADRLVTVTVNTGTASSVLKIYDGATAAGVLIATIDCSTTRTLTYLVRPSSHNLCFVMSAANSDVTITYD